MAVGGGFGEGTGGIGGAVEDIHSIDSPPMSRQHVHIDTFTYVHRDTDVQTR